MINLWNPSHLTLLLVFPTAFLLGIVHGITPDEHTWPITFSYSVGSYSSRGGRRAGFLFSAAFTLQRAIASELAYLALASFTMLDTWNYVVYVVVGAVMAASGVYILKRGRVVHLAHVHILPNHEHPADHEHRGVLHTGPIQVPAQPTADGNAMPWFMPLVHGFIAGWGVGAFAVIIYTVLAPSMPSAALGWVPGALFGLGTMAMQVLLGSLFGAWMARRRLSESAKALVARLVSGRTLAGGGLAFVAAGIAGLLWPTALDRFGIETPLLVHNLHTLGVGFILAVPVLFGVAAWAFTSALREVGREGAAAAPVDARVPRPAH
jgi:hypothetical protein